jgi:hypothetical protein
MKVDFKALGKALLMTTAVFGVALGVGLLARQFGGGILFGFNVIFLVSLFYYIFKD